MSVVRESSVPVSSRLSRRPARRGRVSLVAAAVLVSACGSGDEGPLSDATAVVASAQENAVVAGAVCYSWPNGTTDAQSCAVGLKGPGGGRVFYDAGSEQPWGRFLEVAPQAWNGMLVDCGECGAATGVAAKTSDGGDSKGRYRVCAATATWLLETALGQTGDAIGDGRRNTSVIGGMPECVAGGANAFTQATAYRGGGLNDWYLPSLGELKELCNYDGRSAIGGFSNKIFYISSSANISMGNPASFKALVFDKAPCVTSKTIYRSDTLALGWVRPIRAFS